MPRPLIKQEPPNRAITFGIVLNLNLTFYSPLRVRSLRKPTTCKLLTNKQLRATKYLYSHFRSG
ncbi:hypothetical protein BDV19DRAFT_374941, partial [Aspergillus venezuelensis]